MLKEFLKNKYNKLNLKEFLEFAKNIANTAGDIMRHYFNSNNGSYYKNDNTIVTKADNEINQYLIDQVKKAYPTHSVDGEEQQFGKSKFVWVCDPIDGTAMYARNIPTAVFSLAFVVDGVPVVGVILDPWTNTLYSAIKGNGAFANDKKIIVNDTKFGDKSSVSHFDNVSYFEYDILDLIKNFTKETYFTSLGSIARAGMCVADGGYTLAIFPGTYRKNCDVAAIKVIVEEAGGKVTDLFGNEQRYDQSINGAIISNGVVHDEIVKYTKKYITKK